MRHFPVFNNHKPFKTKLIYKSNDQLQAKTVSRLRLKILRTSGFENRDLDEAEVTILDEHNIRNYTNKEVVTRVEIQIANLIAR